MLDNMQMRATLRDLDLKGLEIGNQQTLAQNQQALALAELDLKEQAGNRELERFYELQRMRREEREFDKRKALIQALSALGQVPFL